TNSCARRSFRSRTPPRRRVTKRHRTRLLHRRLRAEARQPLPTLTLRDWQRQALRLWTGGGHKGIVSVVTGGGKTVFALACIRELSPDTTMIVVPTIALLDQWWEETSAFFDLKLDEINV